MHPVIQKTFFGLSGPYYFRHLLFSGAFGLFGIFLVVANGSPSGVPLLAKVEVVAIMLADIFLYPYARFAYERIVGFIMGDNVFIVNAFLLLMLKFITMTWCMAMAVFIAPVGLALLYWHHSRQAASQ